MSSHPCPLVGRFEAPLLRGVREELPSRRSGVTVKKIVGGKFGGTKIFVTLGYYSDGRLGEIFIDMKQEGDWQRTVSHALAQTVSVALQYGTPPEAIARALKDWQFHPSDEMYKSYIDAVGKIIEEEAIQK